MSSAPSRKPPEAPTALRTIGVAATAAIPHVGGPLATLLDAYLPDRLQQRRDEFLAAVGDDLTRLEEQLSPEVLAQRLQQDEFVSTFVKCLRRALEEHLSEKRRAFRAIIANSARGLPADFDELTLFIRLVGDLTVDEIRVLRLVVDGLATGEDEKSGILFAVQQQWPGIDRDYLMACVTELLRSNLVISGPRRDFEPPDPDKPSNHRLTKLGQRFVKYISLP